MREEEERGWRPRRIVGGGVVTSGVDWGGTGTWTGDWDWGGMDEISRVGTWTRAVQREERSRSGSRRESARVDLLGWRLIRSTWAGLGSFQVEELPRRYLEPSGAHSGEELADARRSLPVVPLLAGAGGNRRCRWWPWVHRRRWWWW